MNQPPLNPDAQTRLDIMAGQIGAWMDEWEDAPLGTLTAHMATHVANRLAENGVTTLAVAQPVVNSVESIPAKMRMLAFEAGEVEIVNIPDGQVFVGFEMATDRAWSMADKVTIHIERKDATNGR